MGRTGDSSPLRERKSHLNSSFLGHIKNVLPSCKDWITASTLTVCGLCQDLWCLLTNHFLAVKFLRFVNNVADKCTAITQHLQWVLKQGYLLLEEWRRMSAHPSSKEWSTFCVSKEKKHVMRECLGGWISFPESLWSTNGTALSLWGIPATWKVPLLSSTCWRTLPAMPRLL